MIPHSAMHLPCKSEALSSIPRDMLLDTLLLDTMAPAHLQSQGGASKAETVGEWSILARLPFLVDEANGRPCQNREGVLAKWFIKQSSRCRASS